MPYLDDTGVEYLVGDIKEKTDAAYQAKLVSGANIKTVNSTSLLGSGDVAVQPTLVSGTNIKTVNNNSLLGSGNLALDTLPSVSASDNDKVLTVVSGAWAAATPSGGGGVSVTTTTVTIDASDWSNNTCTKSVTGVTASNTVLVTYAPSSKADYVAADIYCSGQDSGTLTFACTTTPTSSIKVNVMIIDGGTTVIRYPIYIVASNTYAYDSYNSTSDTFGAIITEAPSGDVVYVKHPTGVTLSGHMDVSGTTLTFTLIATTSSYKVSKFTVPESSRTNDSISIGTSGGPT